MDGGTGRKRNRECLLKFQRKGLTRGGSVRACPEKRNRTYGNIFAGGIQKKEEQISSGAGRGGGARGT